MIPQEVSVPTLFEDFEVGDRVWFSNPISDKKTFGRVLRISEEYVIVHTDAGGRVYVHDQSQNPLAKISLQNLHKALDITSLQVGAVLSKSIPPVFFMDQPLRTFVTVKSLVPEQEVVVSYIGRHSFLNDEAFRGNLHELEVKMVGWELEG
jgi:hypothetical protein